MMRKIHRVALAAHLKPAMATLEPAFSLASTAWARAFATERRFTFTAPWGAGQAFLLFEPSATATDDYFTLDIAWIRGAAAMSPADLGDALTVPELAPWRSHTQDQVLQRHWFRLRLDDLWTTSPGEYRGMFRFSTASSRYIEQLARIRGLTGKEREDRAFGLLQDCMAEEKGTSDAQAASEVAPAADLACRAVREAAIPAFQRADALCASAP